MLVVKDGRIGISPPSASFSSGSDELSFGSTYHNLIQITASFIELQRPEIGTDSVACYASHGSAASCRFVFR